MTKVDIYIKIRVKKGIVFWQIKQKVKQCKKQDNWKYTYIFKLLRFFRNEVLNQREMLSIWGPVIFEEDIARILRVRTTSS